MSHKEYNSPQYLAQEFFDFLRGQGKYSKFIGRTWKAEHHGVRVSFLLYRRNYDILFEENKGKIYSTLEHLTEDGYELVDKWKLEIKKSSSGRLSRNYIPKVFMREIFQRIKLTNGE